MKTPFLTAYIIIIGIFPGCRKDEIETNVTPEPKWKHYNQSNAPLPDNQINAIAITDNNIKWIGTADGLVQINNSAWTVYNKTNSYLPSTYIQAL
jgi:ligand-binding sensor domain-containing protein